MRGKAKILARLVAIIALGVLFATGPQNDSLKTFAHPCYQAGLSDYGIPPPQHFKGSYVETPEEAAQKSPIYFPVMKRSGVNPVTFSNYEKGKPGSSIVVRRFPGLGWRITETWKVVPCPLNADPEMR